MNQSPFDTMHSSWFLIKGKNHPSHLLHCSRTMYGEFKWFSNRDTSRDTEKCNVRSKIWWFTYFCNSHYLSQFAAFFIVVRTKRSIVKSCFWFLEILLVQIKTKIKFIECKTFHKWKAFKTITIHKRFMKSFSSYEKKRTPIALNLKNDPTAGSPTVTLLRLLLPLNDQVWPTSQQTAPVARCYPSIRRSH